MIRLKVSSRDEKDIAVLHAENLMRAFKATRFFCKNLVDDKPKNINFRSFNSLGNPSTIIAIYKFGDEAFLQILPGEEFDDLIKEGSMKEGWRFYITSRDDIPDVPFITTFNSPVGDDYHDIPYVDGWHISKKYLVPISRVCEVLTRLENSEMKDWLDDNNWVYLGENIL